DNNDGLALLSTLRRRHPRLPIVVFTMLNNASLLHAILKLGIHGLVHKSAKTAEVVTALQRVTSGKRYIGQGLRERMERYINSGGARLSPQEVEVIRLFGNGMSVSEIARKFNRSEKTISRQK